MERYSLKIGDKVTLEINPNPVEVVYEIIDIECFFSPNLKVRATLQPIQNFPLPDGGYISKDSTREENILHLVRSRIKVKFN